MINFIFVPGLCNSEEGHWQNYWYNSMENSYCVKQEKWCSPDREKWIENLNNLIKKIKGPKIFVAHSLGCNTVVEWNKKYKCNDIIGAFFVAFPDVNQDDFPKSIVGYSNPPLGKLPFETLAILSENDHYSSYERALYFAKKWGCKTISIGKKGHINIESNIGEWKEGKELFNSFLQDKFKNYL